jgi:hypothetical protein
MLSAATRRPGESPFVHAMGPHHREGRGLASLVMGQLSNVPELSLFSVSTRLSPSETTAL